MKKQLLFYCKRTLFREFSFRMAAVAVLTLLTAQTSFAQVWTVLGSGTNVGSNASTATNMCNKITTIQNVPYVAFIEDLVTKVKKRNSDGTWSQVGGNLVTAAATATSNATSTYPELSVDGNNNLYASYIDVTNSNRLAVVKYNTTNSTWEPLNNDTNNLYVSTVSGTGATSANLKSSPRGVVAFNSSNIPYVAYNEGGIVYVKRFNNNAWETVGNSITATGSTGATANTFIGVQKLIIDENDLPWVASINLVAVGSVSGTVSLHKYDSGTSIFSSVGDPTTNSIRELDMTFVKGTGTTNANKIAVVTYNTTNSNKATVYIYNKTTPGWEASATLSVATTSYVGITSDPNGNVYAIFRDTPATGFSNVTRVKMLQNNKTNSPASNWVELSSSGTYLESTTCGWSAIGIGNSSYPYIAYNLLAAAPSATIVRVYDPTTTWSGSAWSAGTPTTTLEAIIDGNYSTTANGAFTAKKLTVNGTKTLTINSTTNVTVQDNVINNGTLLVENNANLVQVNNYANIGSVTVNRNSNALSRLDYTMWSSPVTGTQTLAQFSPLTSQSPSRFYTYDSATNLYVNEPFTNTFAAGKGYLIRMPNTAVTSPSTETFAGVFTGVPNNGNVSLTGLTSNAYYAIGNPYPSTISAASFLSGNATAGTTLYFWRKRNDATSVATSYATWTTAGGVANSGDPNAIVLNGTIQVGQGFIVAAGSAGTLNFTNTMRTSDNTNQILKIKPADEKSRVWLNLSSQEGGINQMLVAYMDGANADIDAADGKYINDGPTALTSNINNEEYIIQGRSPFEDTDVVPLAFKAKTAGEYTIAIDHTDGVFAKGQSVYLVDSVTAKETNLSNEAYTFTAESGTANNRFTLKYQSSSKTVGSPVFNENTVTVYKSNGTLYVNSAASAIVTIKVFNLQGRLIGEQKDVNATTAAIKNLKATQQVLLVQVTSEDGKVVTKKVVN